MPHLLPGGVLGRVVYEHNPLERGEGEQWNGTPEKRKLERQPRNMPLLNYCGTFRPGNDAADVASSCRLVAHRVISLRRGIWSLSGHSGL
jgi:hypothetical protein